MFRRSVPVLTLLLLALALSGSASASGPYAGLGLGFVDATDLAGFEGGVGLQLGYTLDPLGGWEFGLGGAYFDGLTRRGDLDGDRRAGNLESDTLVFDTLTLHASAQPQGWPLLLKAGGTYVDYRTVREHDSGFGVAAGAALVLGNERFRLHLFDYEHLHVHGRGFNLYTLSLRVFLGR